MIAPGRRQCFDAAKRIRLGSLFEPASFQAGPAIFLLTFSEKWTWAFILPQFTSRCIEVHQSILISCREMSSRSLLTSKSRGISTYGSSMCIDSIASLQNSCGAVQSSPTTFGKSWNSVVSESWLNQRSPFEICQLILSIFVSPYFLPSLLADPQNFSQANDRSWTQ
jgi:hypothetical protein